MERIKELEEQLLNDPSLRTRAKLKEFDECIKNELKHWGFVQLEDAVRSTNPTWTRMRWNVLAWVELGKRKAIQEMTSKERNDRIEILRDHINFPISNEDRSKYLQELKDLRRAEQEYYESICFNSS